MYIFIAFMALLLWHIYDEEKHRKERREMLNRIMSKDYQEFQYYEKKYPTDIKEVVKLREEEREVRKTVPVKESTLGQEMPSDVQRFLDATETDWRPDEVDIDKIKEMIDAKPNDEEDRG